MRKLLNFLTLMAFLIPGVFSQTITETYTLGDIETDNTFTTLPGFSTCPGSLTVTIPAGHWITGVDVAYDMTAGNGAFMNEQRSWLYSPTITAGEANISSGTGTFGTMSYNRTNLDFANGATGTIVFEIHAGRSWSSWGYDGCDTYNNKVDNNTWVLTVHHELIPTCMPPTALNATSMTATTATLGWTIGGTETEWDVYWGEAATLTTPDATTTPTEAGVTSTSLPISGLSGVTDYAFFVRADCGSGDLSPWAGPYTFTTPCVAYNVSIFEDFDTVSTPDIPACWSKIEESTSTFANVTTSTTNSYSAPNNIQFYNAADSDADLVLITPQIAEPLNSLQVSFFARRGANANSNLILGTMSDPTYLTTFSPVDTFYLTATHTEFSLFLNHLTTTDTYLAFKHYAGATYRYVYLDDILIEEIPSCPPVKDLAADNITGTTADLSWTPIGTESLWHVVVIETATGDTTVVHSPTSPTWTPTTLDPSTTYEYYVQADCGGGDTSTWGGPFVFLTTQIAATIPFTEDFEIWPNGWTIVNGTETNQWHIGTATAHTGTQSAYISNDNGVTNEYTVSGAASVVHLYRDIEFPAGTNPFNLKFNWKGMGESGVWDFLRVFLIPITTTPVAGSQLTTSQVGGTYHWEADWQTENIELDAAVYADDTWRLVFSWRNDGTGGTQPPVAIDDIEITIITCPNPSALIADNISQTTANLHWLAGSTEDTWSVMLINTGTGDTTAIQTVNDTTWTPTNLDPATVYHFFVQAICGVGDESIWVGPYEFTTECGIYSATMIENFDNVSTPNLPICWSSIVESSSSFAVVQTTTSTTPASAPNHVEMYNSTTAGATTYLMLVSPEMSDIGTVANQLVFKAKRGVNAEILIIGTLTDPTDGTTFTPFDTINNLTTTYQEFVVPFLNYTGTDNYLAFKHGNSVSTRYVYIDDVSWEPMPSCPGITPGTILASNPTFNSIDLSWTELIAASEWEIEYGLTGFTQGDGDFVIANTNPYTLAGLTHSKTYDAYIRSICAVGDTSVWEGPVIFSTECDVFNLPIFENFDTVATPDLPLCWSKIEETSSTSAYVQTSTLNTYSAPNSLRFYNAGDANAELLLITPEIADPLNTLFVQFYARNISADSDIILGTIADPTDETTFTPIDTLYLSTTYSQFTHLLNTLTTSDNYLAFKALFDGTGKNVYLDDVLIDIIPTCLWVTDLNVDTTTLDYAVVSWTPQGTETEWQVEYGLSGLTPGTGTLVTLNNNPDTIFGLQHSSLYEFYVRAVCDPVSGDTSAWSGPHHFTTDCGIYALPFEEDFTGIANNDLPLCWTATHVNWYVWNSDDAGGTAPELVLDYDPFSVDTFVVLTPPIDANAATSLYLSFKHYLDHWDTGYAIGALVSINAGLTWDTLWMEMPTADIGPEEVLIDMSAYAGHTVIVAWALAGDIYNIYYWSIDDVVIAEIPACTEPTALEAVNIETFSADLMWMGGAETTWEIEWDTLGFTQGDGNHIVTSNKPYALSGLTPETDYEFYVRAICLFDTTTWAGPAAFATLATCIAPDSLAAHNLTHTSVDVSWFSIDSTLWQVQWDTAGFVPGTGHIATTTDNPFTFDNLMPATDYDIYVRVVCDTILGDTSYWTGPLTITTHDPCFEPTNLHVIDVGLDFAELAWTAGGMESQWQIEWDTAGFALGTGNIVTTTDNPHMLTGLDDNTNYEFYVRAICDTLITDTSAWAGPEAFSTLGVGMSQLGQTLAIDIYPNPSNGLFNIHAGFDADVLTLSVLNLQGQIVHEEQLNGLTNGTVKEIDFSNLSAGVYHLRINDGSTISNHKLIIN